MRLLSLFIKKPPKKGANPALDFFLTGSSRERKRVYNDALREADKDQLRVLKIAKEKARA